MRLKGIDFPGYALPVDVYECAASVGSATECYYGGGLIASGSSAVANAWADDTIKSGGSVAADAECVG